MILVLLLAMSSLAYQASDIYFEIQRGFTVWSDVIREVSLRYVDEVDPAFLTKVGIDAMLKTLDPYTVLIDESASRELDIITKGTYAGVGLEVRRRDGSFIVYQVQEGYPAFKAGIRPGDEILEIDGVPLSGLSVEDANSLMLGDAGSVLTLKILHGKDGQTERLELERERISLGNIGYSDWLNKQQGVGYIQLTRFAPQAAADIRQKIEAFSQGDSLKLLILDFRNNPGGLLNEAVDIVDLFVEAGIDVVSTDGRLSEMNDRYTTDEDIAYAGPLVILQNSSSASASEVVAGALQDLDRAVVIGERSYGKGLVQIIRPLSYDNSLKITVSRYLLPSGRSIQRISYDRNEGGFTQQEDSTRQAFQTKSGRKVLDGRGIDPDIQLSRRIESDFLNKLLREDHIFDFANDWVENKKRLADDIQDQLLVDFESYLEQQDFSFETESDYIYKQLIASLEQEGVSVGAQSGLQQMQRLLETQKEQQVESDQKELGRILELEVIERIKGSEQRKARSLMLDILVDKAIEVGLNAEQYQAVLEGNN